MSEGFAKRASGGSGVDAGSPSAGERSGGDTVEKLLGVGAPCKMSNKHWFQLRYHVVAHKGIQTRHGVCSSHLLADISWCRLHPGLRWLSAAKPTFDCRGVQFGSPAVCGAVSASSCTCRYFACFSVMFTQPLENSLLLQTADATSRHPLRTRRQHRHRLSDITRLKMTLLATVLRRSKGCLAVSVVG